MASEAISEHFISFHFRKKSSQEGGAFSLYFSVFSSYTHGFPSLTNFRNSKSITFSAGCLSWSRRPETPWIVSPDAPVVSKSNCWGSDHTDGAGQWTTQCRANNFSAGVFLVLMNSVMTLSCDNEFLYI